MEIRFVEPAEVEQLRRNVQTAFPSKTPQALLDNMPEELVRPEGDILAVLMMTAP